MSILINKNTKVVVQGMTGKEGQKGARAMLDYGTQVLCGVTPGKGGQEVEGKPIFNSVGEAIESVIASEAKQSHGQEDKQKIAASSFDKLKTPRNDSWASVIYVPPFAAKVAIIEAIEAGIGLVNIFTERIPIKDTAYCLAVAKEHGVTILGPSSLGVIIPGVGRLGVVGGPLVSEIFTAGSIGVISRSGGMTNELSWSLRQNGLGQSAAVHIGGDLLVGMAYADVLRLFEKDEATKAVIIFGEHGGSYEFEIVEAIEKKEFTKPLAIFIGGKFASKLPEGMNIGHAGAIVERGKGATEKAVALSKVGVMIADKYEDLINLVKSYA